jgi:hypothetical protein
MSAIGLLQRLTKVSEVREGSEAMSISHHGPPHSFMTGEHQEAKCASISSVRAGLLSELFKVVAYLSKVGLAIRQPYHHIHSLTTL